MNYVECNLYPNLKKTITMCKFKYVIYDYNPFKYAKITVILLDENNTPVDTRVFELNLSNGFLNWSNDDKFLETWIKTQLYS